MPRRRSKKKTDFNQYLPWIIVGALVLVFLVIGADPTGKFTEVTEYSFVTETGEMYDTQDIPAVELTQEGIPGARESQDIYVLSNNVKIIKLDNVPSELDYNKDKLTCRKCKRVFKIEDGIPIMLPKDF